VSDVLLLLLLHPALKNAADIKRMSKIVAQAEQNLQAQKKSLLNNIMFHSSYG
jgi:hypothetical protein